MALYEGLRPSSEREAPIIPRPAARPAVPERAWKELHHERSSSRPSASFLDNLLGQGSQAKVSQVFAPSRKDISLPPPPGGAAGRRPAAGGPAWRSAKVEAVGSGQSTRPRGKKGVGRALLVVIVLVIGLSRLHSWNRPSARVDVAPKPTPRAESASNGGWSQDLASLFRPSNEAERAKRDAAEALEARRKEAEEAAHLASLPVDPAGGTALALWQDGAGRWWQVNGKGELRLSAGPSAKDSLGLPELRGVSAAAEEHGGGKRLSLKLPAGLLKELLPLEPSVASEVRAVLLDDPTQPGLLTHDGTRCLLDASDWERRQRRLGLVLADLAAKKRRALLIDLRYEDTAVVRPAGRV